VRGRGEVRRETEREGRGKGVPVLSEQYSYMRTSWMRGLYAIVCVIVCSRMHECGYMCQCICESVDVSVMCVDVRACMRKCVCVFCVVRMCMYAMNVCVCVCMRVCPALC